jgi:antitoxin ParD1/3/4
MIGVETSERGEIIDGKIVFSQLQQKLERHRQKAGL